MDIDVLGIIVGVISIGIITYLLFVNKNNKSQISKNNFQSNQIGSISTIPNWLLDELNLFKNKALSYSLYSLSLDVELSPKAKAKQKELNIKVFTIPSLILYDAQTAANCSDEDLDKYLQLYYKQITGNKYSGNLNIKYGTENLLQEKANSEAQELQKS